MLLQFLVIFTQPKKPIATLQLDMFRNRLENVLGKDIDTEET